jgi:hypothetical protein
VVVVVALTSGCASLLGDFTANGASGDDGGLPFDGSQITGDGSNGNDAGPPSDANDDGSQNLDAGDAADAAITPLACVEQGAAGRVKLGSITNGGTNDNYQVRLFNTSIGNQTTYRAYVPDNSQTGPTTYHLYSFGNGGGQSGTDLHVPIENGNVLAVARYATGIAVLYQTYSGSLPDGGSSVAGIQLIKLEDAAIQWTIPLTVSGPITIPNCSGNNNKTEASLFVNNAANNDYFIEFEQQCPPAPIVDMVWHFDGSDAMTFGPANWPPPPGTSPDAGIGFDVGGITVSGTSVYGIANPGNNGPVTGVGSSLYTADVSSLMPSMPHELPLVNTGDIMQAFTIDSLASTGGVGLGVLEANLNSTTVTPVMYVGNVPGSKLASLVPSTDLRATTLASISDLPINNASYHWESFATPASDNLVGVASIYPSSNGLDFIWWDGNGNVRAKQTNTDGFLYFAPATVGALPVYAGDMTFSSAPFGGLAGFEMVFLQDDLEASASTIDVWATQVNCTAP